jgi:hypothetical protein
MPCSDSRSYDSDYFGQRIDELARMLCAACQALESAGLAVPDIASPWWAEHKERDRIRLKHEKEARERREEEDRLFREAIASGNITIDGQPLTRIIIP